MESINLPCKSLRPSRLEDLTRWCDMCLLIYVSTSEKWSFQNRWHGTTTTITRAIHWYRSRTSRVVAISSTWSANKLRFFIVDLWPRVAAQDFKPWGQGCSQTGWIVTISFHNCLTTLPRSWFPTQIPISYYIADL